jgi:Family of unknown function (DUF5681)
MGRRRNDDYEVGYGRPPKHRQFRKGQSGNPNGRPRGSRNASTLLDEALKERVVVSEAGRRRGMTKLEAILKQLVNRAAQGDHRATQLLLAHQIPRIEEHEASLSKMTDRMPLPPPPSAEEKRRRALEIALILQEAGAIATENNEVSDDAPESRSDIKKPR